MPKQEIIWLPKPEAHDYPAAQSYLNLLFEDAVVDQLIKQLKHAPIKEFKAKDVFRASGLNLLGVSNLHVEKNKKKIKKGIGLSPILLVRESKLSKVIIADGYHRMCAIYHYDEDANIPCKVVSLS